MSLIGVDATKDNKISRAKGGLLCIINTEFVILVVKNLRCIILSFYINPTHDVKFVLGKIEIKLKALSDFYAENKIITGGDFNALVGNKNIIVDEQILYNCFILS